MRSASIAEWVVGRFTSKKRAASVVGDLVELEPQKGLLWFWASFAEVVVSLSWRACLRLIAAWFVYGVAYFVLAAVGMFYLPRDPQHWPPNVWLLWALSTSSTVGALLWMTLAYAGLRYGLRGKVTRLTLAWASLATVAISFWWQPTILFLCLALSIWMASISISKIRYRKATLVLLGTVVTGYASDGLMAYLSRVGFRTLYSGQRMFFPLMAASASLIVTWITVVACSRMHNKLFGNKPLDEEAKEGLA